MPFLSTTAIRTSFRLVLVASILIIFTSGNGYGFSLLSWVPSEGDFALGEWQGGVIGGYEWEDQQTTTGNNTTTVLRNRFDEDVFLRNNAFYLIDPRLLSGSAGVNLDFYQENDKYNGANKHQDGTLIGFDVNTTILGQMPYTGLLFAHRNENNTSTDFGGQTYSLNQSFGGMATLRQDSFLRESFPYFSADVYARQEEADQSTTQFGQTFTVNETRDIGGFDAEKGFQTADLDVTYQIVDDSYTGSTPAYSFITQWASCNYSLDFGPTLNRRWDSLISYLTRSGNGVDESFLYADEKLRIDHFKNLSTTYEYLLTDTNTQGQQDVDNSLTLQVQYRPFRNLTNTLTMQGSYETVSPAGHQDFVAVEGNSDYTHPLPWGGSLLLGGDGRYEIDQAHISGPVTVLDEKHTAPAFFGPGIGFTLSASFIVTSTIVMYDTRLGTGGAQRVLTQLGVDYIIQTEAQLTKIVILATSLKILPGDPLEVSYSYVVGPDGRYSTTSLSGDAGVTFGWISLLGAYQQSKQSMQSGVGAQYLYSTHQETAELDLHKDWEWVDARGSALYEIFHTQSQAAGVFDYTLQSYGEYLSFRPGWNTTLNLDGNEMYTDYTVAPTRHNSDLDFEAALDRFLTSGNYFTVFARARQASETDYPTETDYEAGVRGNFRYGKIFFWPWLSWINRSYGPTKTNDPHIMLKIGRDL
jgi:hypothetical protein